MLELLSISKVLLINHFINKNKKIEVVAEFDEKIVSSESPCFLTLFGCKIVFNLRMGK